jgi:hypothetical protein
MSGPCSARPDAVTAYIWALVEVIDANEAATAAQGKPTANAAYDRLESAHRAKREALAEVMAQRASLVAIAEWREALMVAERARNATRDLAHVPKVPEAVKALYRAKDAAGARESDTFVAMRRDVIARMGDEQ